MEDLLSMKKLPAVEVLQDIAIELGVNPAFVEKDWFAVLVLEHISTIAFLQIVFTGGTSLSKGYGLIKRFSEDLDFRICTSPNLNKSQRKSMRSRLISEISRIKGISVLENSVESHNASKFFSFNVEYPQRYNPVDALRPYLKLEFSFEEIVINPELKSIQSFVSQFTSANETDCMIKTISPIEIAANKFSALLWRVNIKDRSAAIGSPQNDPTIVRHLHDLCALEKLVLESKRFKPLVAASFEVDRGRAGSEKGKTEASMSKETLSKLKSDSIYKVEYTRFVDAMSYAKEDEMITFEKSIQSFERIVALF